MIESSLISTDLLVDDLRLLCAAPSSIEQADSQAEAASQVAALMQQRGLKVQLLPTAGAPIVVGRRAGRSPFTLLLYHHYDTTPVGHWRAWYHEPFQLAEREGSLFGRGVAHGKGPLAAHLAAISGMIASEGELPVSVVVVAEGESMVGSPHFAKTIAQHAEAFQAQACLASAGERDTTGRPFCYSGSKGLLQARLIALGANQTLPSGFASSVANPLWRLIWALAAVKSDQEEILIEGFYDDVVSLSRAENQALRAVHLAESQRLEAWGIENFLFDMRRATLAAAEATLPTCNVGSIVTEPSPELATLPMLASARLDFQLVPRQRPHTIFDLLRKHLRAKGFEDLEIERLPGSYSAYATPTDAAFVQLVREAGRPFFGEPLAQLPLGTFTLPLNALAETSQIPCAVVGCARPESATHGPNENIPLADLMRHGQMLSELCAHLT